MKIGVRTRNGSRMVHLEAEIQRRVREELGQRSEIENMPLDGLVRIVRRAARAAVRNLTTN